jgi:hypothetical protein
MYKNTIKDLFISIIIEKFIDITIKWIIPSGNVDITIFLQLNINI